MWNDVKQEDIHSSIIIWEVLYSQFVCLAQGTASGVSSQKSPLKSCPVLAKFPKPCLINTTQGSWPWGMFSWLWNHVIPDAVFILGKLTCSAEGVSLIINCHYTQSSKKDKI